MHLAIESIGAGSARPRKIVLWLGDTEEGRDLPRGLRRLVARGLDVRYCPDYGPHKKYYPALNEAEVEAGSPLVTADDDTFYPSSWLLRLLAAHYRFPESVVAQRAYVMEFSGGTLAPYARWRHATTWERGISIFPTGMGGVLYPKQATDAIRQAGDGFLLTAPRADDVWLHSITSSAGISGVKVGVQEDRLDLFPIRAAGEIGLAAQNVGNNQNDVQIAATYKPEEISSIAQSELMGGRGRRLVAVLAESVGDGGAERFLNRLANRLPEYYTSILLGNVFGWNGALRVPLDMGAKWRTPTLLPGFLRLPAQRRRLANILQALEPEIVHSHFKREQIGLTSIAARFAAVIWTEHGRFPGGGFGLVLKPLYRAVSVKSRAVACVSKFVERDVARLVGDRTAVLTIENSVDQSHLRIPSEAERVQARLHLGLPVEARVASIIGRLDSSKRPEGGVQGAVEAGYEVLVVGDGALSSSLREQFAHQSNVHFIGATADPLQSYWASDVLVFSSNGEGEGAPTVVLEAASTGVPAVFADDSGFGAWAHRFNGSLSKPTPADISRVLKMYSGQPQSNQDKLLRRSQVSDVNEWIELYVGLYEKAIRESQSGPKPIETFLEER